MKPAGDGPGLHVLAVAVDDAADVLEGEVADGVEIVLPDVQPVGDVALLKREQPATAYGNLLFGQRLHPGVQRFPVEGLLGGFDVAQVMGIETKSKAAAIRFLAASVGGSRGWSNRRVSWRGCRPERAGRSFPGHRSG